MQPDDARILDILLAAEQIAEYLAGKTYDEYLQTNILRAGVQWQVYTIGEAARQISTSFKDQHPSVPWHRIIGARNVLAHEYGRIDHDIMWKIASVHVPDLVSYLKPFGPHEVEE